MSPEDNEHKEARHSSTKYKQSRMMQDGIEALLMKLQYTLLQTCLTNASRIPKQLSR